MICEICGGLAVRVDAGSKYEERACPQCGHYRITGKVLVLMKAHDWRFDVDLTQRWIAAQGVGIIPTIDSHQAGRLIDV
jgi:DNA-directed RNA polymerase subunit RPC12/RpoP